MSSQPEPNISIEEQCELGQQQLMGMDYLAAGQTLADAAKRAQLACDFALMSRILLPLQEARRQRRQRAGEGVVRLDLFPHHPYDQPNPSKIIKEIPCGTVLVAGCQLNNIGPALELRSLQNERGLYLDVFLGVQYLTGPSSLAIFPLPDCLVPEILQPAFDDLKSQLPVGAILYRTHELLSLCRHRTSAETFSFVMSIWERLHAPFLAAADAETDPIRKIAAYQKTLEVDYACELAHQRLAEVVHSLARR